MSSLGQAANDLLTDLLVKQITEGLSVDEESALASTDPAIVAARRHSLELLLGALHAALVDKLESPPERLAAGIEQQAAKHFEKYPPQRNIGAVHPRTDFSLNKRKPNPSSIRWAWLSAAACLVLAMISWMRPPREVMAPPPMTVELKVPAPKVPEFKAPSVPRSVSQERDALFARADSLKVTLNPSKDPAAAGVSADVVWDPLTHSGFLHIVGLKANDPAVRQYQAWVFDGLRDKRYPLDCALFDVPQDGAAVIIPIHTAIPVRLAKAFAITVEEPGGVVVPDKVHVVAVGSAG